MDEIFGASNFISQISYKTTSGRTTDYLSASLDHILWYANDHGRLTYNQLYFSKQLGTELAEKYQYGFDEVGRENRLADDEFTGKVALPVGVRAYCIDNLTSSKPPGDFAVPWRGEERRPSSRYWSTSPDGMVRLIKAERVIETGRALMYRRFLDDFLAVPLSNYWEDTSSGASRSDPKRYVVQTSPLVIERCILMASNPGDLVLDPTCGGGTTAFVAERWGRRWITIDTSRIAITLAKQRLLTKCDFPFFRLKNEKEGVTGGFVYKSLSHVKRGCPDLC